mgnify:CR=1 FL=1
MNIFISILRWIVDFIGIVFTTILGVAREFPRATVLILGTVGFIYCLRNVPGFGNAAVDIIAVLIFLLILGVFTRKKRR